MSETNVPAESQKANSPFLSDIEITQLVRAALRGTRRPMEESELFAIVKWAERIRADVVVLTGVLIGLIEIVDVRNGEPVFGAR